MNVLRNVLPLIVSRVDARSRPLLFSHEMFPSADGGDAAT